MGRVFSHVNHLRVQGQFGGEHSAFAFGSLVLVQALPLRYVGVLVPAQRRGLDVVTVFPGMERHVPAVRAVQGVVQAPACGLGHSLVLYLGLPVGRRLVPVVHREARQNQLVGGHDLLPDQLELGLARRGDQKRDVARAGRVEMLARQLVRAVPSWHVVYGVGQRRLAQD